MDDIKEVVVLKKGEHSRLCYLKDGKIVELMKLNLPANGKYTISETGWLAVITRRGNRIALFNWKEGKGRESIRIFPGKAKAQAMFLINDYLLVSKRYRENNLGYYDLSLKNPQWISIDNNQCDFEIEHFVNNNNRLFGIGTYSAYAYIVEINFQHDRKNTRSGNEPCFIIKQCNK